MPKSVLFSPIHSLAQENYLKAIYLLSLEGSGSVSTQLLSRRLSTTPASVSGMVNKLADQGYLHRKKYKGFQISAKGTKVAVSIIRRHRLWEVFLYEKLGFDWSEVHEIAEELEHIHSDKLMQRLDAYLNYPQTDPHGDPIPNSSGEMPFIAKTSLASLRLGASAKLVGTKDSSQAFLRHIDALGLSLGIHLKIINTFAYDGAMEIEVAAKGRIFLSKKVTDKLLVVKQSQ